MIQEATTCQELATSSRTLTDLVRVLAGGGNPHRARPVVVQVRQLVAEPLDLVGLEAAGVLDDVVRGGIDRSLQEQQVFIVIRVSTSRPLVFKLL